MSNQFVDCGSFQNPEFKWTHSANWLLINSYLDMKDEFRDPVNRKRDLWIRIADKFRENGYDIPFELLDKKFRNLKATYYQVKERKRHSSNKQIKWEYFKVFEDLLQEEDAVASASVAIETPLTSVVQEDPRLANFRSSVYVPVDGRKRKRTSSKSKSPKETTKLVNIEPVVEALDDETMDDNDSKPLVNGDHRFKEELNPVDGTIMEDSQDGTFEDDDEEYEDDISANYEVPSFSKKPNLSNLEAKKLQAETRYFHKKADYFEKQTTCLDIQRKLMILQAHKLKLEIERMKSEKKGDSFAT